MRNDDHLLIFQLRFLCWKSSLPFLLLAGDKRRLVFLLFSFALGLIVDRFYLFLQLIDFPLFSLSLLPDFLFNGLAGEQLVRSHLWPLGTLRSYQLKCFFTCWKDVLSLDEITFDPSGFNCSLNPWRWCIYQHHDRLLHSANSVLSLSQHLEVFLFGQNARMWL